MESPRRNTPTFGMARLDEQTHHVGVDIELLVMPDCPHADAAAALLRTEITSVDRIADELGDDKD
jgi:hypothetical protein